MTWPLQGGRETINSSAQLRDTACVCADHVNLVIVMRCIGQLLACVAPGIIHLPNLVTIRSETSESCLGLQHLW